MVTGTCAYMFIELTFKGSWVGCKALGLADAHVDLIKVSFVDQCRFEARSAFSCNRHDSVNSCKSADIMISAPFGHSPS